MIAVPPRLYRMHPIQHQCTQDCETIHKEITKKLVLLIRNSRLNSLENVKLSANKNNWFGLETPLDDEWKQEECVKTLLSPADTEEREISILVFLSNEDASIGIEDSTGREPIRKGKILLEVWNLKFRPKVSVNETVEGRDSSIRKLYKRCSFYIRSLYTILRLLPVYSLIQQYKLPFEVEVRDGNVENLKDRSVNEILKESLILDPEKNLEWKSFESVQRNELSSLQTDHGDLEVQVLFKRIMVPSMKFFTIVRSPAIRVPQQVIKARDIQIRSSPAGSGDWVDMGKFSNEASTKRNSIKTNRHHHHQQVPVLSSTNPKSIRILTTSHRPSSQASAVAVLTTTLAETKPSLNITEFIKIFEKPEPFEEAMTSILTPASSSVSNIQSLLQIMETERSKKIIFDRWLEELEIEHEEHGFDLVNNME